MSSWTQHNSWYIKLKVWRDLNNVLTKSQSLKANLDLIFNLVSDFSLWFNFYVSIHYDNEYVRNFVRSRKLTMMTFLLQWSKSWSLNKFFFNFFIKCMQFMTMTLFRRCMCAMLHVIWSKLLLYIFSLINHIDSLHI